MRAQAVFLYVSLFRCIFAIQHLQSEISPLALVMASSNKPRSSCYFSIIPSQHSYNDETPLSTTSCYTPGENVVSDPSNPLLAYRPSQSRQRTSTNSRMEVPSLLQLQTQVAHSPTPKRPQPRPLQNVLAVSDDSNMCSSSPLSNSPIELARCSRCQRSQSIDMNTGTATNMVSYGLNLFYCTRCANIVGFSSR